MGRSCRCPAPSRSPRSLRSPRSPRGPPPPRLKSLISELQSCCSCCVCEGGDTAVIAEPAAIEDDLGHAGGLGPLGDQAADLGGGGDVAAVVGAEVLFDGGRRGQRAAGAVVDDLGG